MIAWIALAVAVLCWIRTSYTVKATNRNFAKGVEALDQKEDK